MCFVVGKLFGVIDAAIRGNVNGEDYLSHWIVQYPSLIEAQSSALIANTEVPLLSTVHPIVVCQPQESTTEVNYFLQLAL